MTIYLNKTAGCDNSPDFDEKIRWLVDTFKAEY